MPQWLSTVLALGGGGAIAGMFNFFKERVADSRRAVEARNARAETRQEAVVHEQATVQITKLEGEKQAQAAYFDALQQINKDRAQDAKDRAKELETIRGEMARIKSSLEHRIMNLQNYLGFVREIYHHVYHLLTIEIMKGKQMLARIKKLDRENFDPTEFPETEDIKPLDPKELFKQMVPYDPVLQPVGPLTATLAVPVVSDGAPDRPPGQTARIDVRLDRP